MEVYLSESNLRVRLIRGGLNQRRGLNRVFINKHFNHSLIQQPMNFQAGQRLYDVNQQNRQQELEWDLRSYGR